MAHWGLWRQIKKNTFSLHLVLGKHKYQYISSEIILVNARHRIKENK